MRLLVLTLVSTFLVFGCSRRYALIEHAEESSRQGDYAAAIDLYRQHIAWRLSISDRPAWENPYFYLLLIGDLQLAQEHYDEALASFELAEKNGVEPSLVSDRFRYAASLLEQQGKIDRAVAILTKYRTRDPLLYDLTLDRLAKEQVRAEDQSGHTSPRPTAITPAPAQR